MTQLFSQLHLSEVHGKIFRNIVSAHPSQDLFDDLSDDPNDWALAQHLENQVKPPPYQSHTPIIHRPFEDAHWCNAIAWPFTHWQSSRFSDGSFGVWYGCDLPETSVYETAYHWLQFLSDAGFENHQVIAERKIYEVQCNAALIDLRPLVATHPMLIHEFDYSYAQSIGARLHQEGHPGIVTHSVRKKLATNYVVFNSQILSNPQLHCQVTYRLENQIIVVEKQKNKEWLSIPTNIF